MFISLDSDIIKHKYTFNFINIQQINIIFLEMFQVHAIEEV
jgi:hypothetical protein